MKPAVLVIDEKKLIGIHMKMSHADNKTVNLWKEFMPRRKEIKNRVDTNYYSLQGTDPSKNLREQNPEAVFEKWALVEVTDFENVPEGMESFVLKAGKYATLKHKGHSIFEFINKVNYILKTWLPESEFVLDNRPDFEILPEDYRSNPDLAEEIWIPIKKVL